MAITVYSDDQYTLTGVWWTAYNGELHAVFYSTAGYAQLVIYSDLASYSYTINKNLIRLQAWILCLSYIMFNVYWLFLKFCIFITAKQNDYLTEVTASVIKQYTAISQLLISIAIILVI